MRRVALVLVAVAGGARADEAPASEVATVREATAFVLAYDDLPAAQKSAAGMRLEDEVIPRVRRIVDSAPMTRALREAVFDFLVASRGSASEEVSGIGVRLYDADPRGFCTDLSRRSPADRDEPMLRATTGQALEGRPAVVTCPPSGKPSR